jgi:hypothetical protein
MRGIKKAKISVEAHSARIKEHRKQIRTEQIEIQQLEQQKNANRVRSDIARITASTLTNQDQLQAHQLLIAAESDQPSLNQNQSQYFPKEIHSTRQYQKEVKQNDQKFQSLNFLFITVYESSSEHRIIRVVA